MNTFHAAVSALQVALYRQRRQRRTTQIMRLLRRSTTTSTDLNVLSDLSLAALAIKLERLIFLDLPDRVGLLNDEMLELRMRLVIKHILESKDPSKNNNPSEAD
ncbi:unnamed protein product [Aphanomyces euteiches]|uniref:Uncharacterized protein n=1 Tax=Aphanomyces euteiches TaxID=100861 RepID=A0A6G0WQT8_9STRA|nr:hypothetical protein Ae201684_012703 [Aphanomyces euteiches]KAH9095613.1 hypothetical protein Ae201684P_015414 [Aphanomyces euteiches]KAH9146828.1 hypothetical protein AeRB84_009332 [Aphanomyces euteiches]